MPEDDVVLSEEQAAWANRIAAIDQRVAELDGNQATLLDAGMKAPTPLGAGLYKREQQSNEEGRARLLEEREDLVVKIRDSVRSA